MPPPMALPLRPTLMDAASSPTGSTGALCSIGGPRAFTPALRRVQWPHKFKPEMSPRYDGAADSIAFLLAYEESVLEAGGDDKVMTNWLPMDLTGVPRAWLVHLPESSIAS